MLRKSLSFLLFFQPEGGSFNYIKKASPAPLLPCILALVGGVALFTARLAKAKPTWSLYFGGTGLTFSILALDEFTMLHEIHLGVYFIWLGAGLVAATIAVALRSPARAWIWHLSLLTGLAISVAGAYGLELVRPICGSLSILRLDKCLYFFYWEECLEFLGIWLALVALLGHYSDTMPTPSRRTRGLLYCVPLLWVIVLAALALAPRLEARFFAEPAAVDFVSDVRLIGYRTERSAESLNVRLYTSTRQERYEGLGFSIQLIDQADEVSIAGQNEYGGRRYGFWLFGPDDVPVFLKYLQVPIPPDASANRALWVVLTLWRKRGDEYVREKILSSDHRLLDDTQIVLGEFVLPTASSPSISPPLAFFDNGFALESVDLPEHAQAGATLNITSSWRADQLGREDYVQLLHLGNEESGEWIVYDQSPLGMRLPTRLWYTGLADSETWRVPLPADLAAGRYAVFTGLYRSSDLERVPAKDAEGTPWLDNRVVLGSLIIE